MVKTVYFVDREQIEAKLNFLENQLELFKSQGEEWTSSIERAALERICHMSIETILDVGNAIIDGFIMRDPGSYEDIIDILLDRKVLVQDYLEVDHKKLVLTFVTHGINLNAFPTNVRNYIKNELGPVTAFKPV
jgi:uncharacterized protein YutE (UPF0331/DUF86 family)